MAVRCQRIGCDATFTDDDNADGSCRYHDSPMFHDGMKEWICCKQRSHDFSLFLAIPGCKTGKHTTEKPVTKIVSSTPQKTVPSSAQAKTTSDSCSRCRQGFLLPSFFDTVPHSMRMREFFVLNISVSFFT